MLPNFLIVGAMKSGTSTLRDHLARIDDVFIPRAELHFFSNEDHYAKGIQWYERYFQGAEGRSAVGEKTATYSYLSHLPRRIHGHLPDAKLIWLFREPVARTYSHYWHSAKHGSEPLSFERAVKSEVSRVRRDIWRGYQLRSMYSQQVQSYLEVFPQKQMLFLLFEDLIRNPRATVNTVLRFLDVSAEFKPLTTPLHSNVTFAPRSTGVQWMARRLFGRGTRGWNLVQRLNKRMEPGYPRMSDALRHELRHRFEEPNRQLASLTGLDLSVWTPTGERAL